MIVKTTGQVSLNTTIASTSTTTGTLTVNGGIGTTNTITTPTVQVAGTTSGIVTISAGATPTTNTFTLPASNGSSGQVLTSQGASAMTWTIPTPYSTGTWTPTVNGLLSTPSGITYFQQVGNYVKIGDMVFLYYGVSFDYTSSVLANGIVMEGMPFTGSGVKTFVGGTDNQSSTLASASLPYSAVLRTSRVTFYSGGGSTPIAYLFTGAASQTIQGSLTYNI
jgi:hypothetical protein